MKNLNIEMTEYTPSIDFDAQNGILNIKGKSYPENTFEFYTPVNKWIKDYFASISNEKTYINMDVDYLNSSSLKAYFDMFDMFEEAHNMAKIIEIKWIYDEEDDITEETGEDFIEDFEDLNIQLVTK